MRTFIFVLLASSVAFAQHEFEVASVKASEPGPASQGLGGESIMPHPGSLTMRNVRLRSCVKWAYDVKEYQIAGPAWLGSPGWLGSEIDRYDIAAKAAPDTPIPELRLMLQSLLAERFKLTLHRETKDLPSYALTFVKQAPGLHPATDPNGERKTSGKGPALSLTSTSMAEFAELLAGPLGMPVVDATNLQGKFDFELSGKMMGVTKEDQQYEFLNTIQEQLGLKLERRKAPIEMLIIDHIEKTPTAN